MSLQRKEEVEQICMDAEWEIEGRGRNVSESLCLSIRRTAQ